MKNDDESELLEDRLSGYEVLNPEDDHISDEIKICFQNDGEWFFMRARPIFAESNGHG